MKLQLDPRIEPAIMQIAKVMTGSTIRKPNEHIDHIVEKCNDVFGQLQYYLSYGKSKKFVEYVNTSLKTPKQGKWRGALTRKELKNEYFDAEYSDVLKKTEIVFPFFVEFDFGKIMQINEDSYVLEILPYLLTAFYLNSNRMRNREVRKSIATVFKCDPDTEVSDLFVGDAYYRDVRDFCRLFSCESFLPNLFNFGRTDSKTTLGNIKDIDSFREYIKKVSMPVSVEKNADQVLPPQLYYSQIYKVFIYSIIASACAEEFPDNPGIDYKASWDLFSDHTDSFTAASMALTYKVDSLSEPNTDFLQALILCRSSLQSMGVDETYVEIVQRFLAETGTAMPLDEIVRMFEENEITTQKMYQCYTYLFRTYFSPVVYAPFRYPHIFDNLLNGNKLAYIVVQSRQKRSKAEKSS